MGTENTGNYIYLGLVKIQKLKKRYIDRMKNWLGICKQKYQIYKNCLKQIGHEEGSGTIGT